MNIILKNGRILDIMNGTISLGDIIVAEGMIDAVGTVDGDAEQSEVVDLEGKLVIPGLVNAHMHSYAGLAKGSIDNVPLDIYMLHAIAKSNRRTERDVYISTAVEAIQMLQFGTTGVVDHFANRPEHTMEHLDAAVQAYQDVGMRACIAPMYSDLEYMHTVPFTMDEFEHAKGTMGSSSVQSVEEYLEVCIAAARKWNSSNTAVKIMLGTDSPNRCSEKLLEKTGEAMVRHNLGWQTHLLEAHTQSVFALNKHGKSAVRHLKDMGLLNDRVSFVHYVWGTQDDHKVLAESGVNVIHCPSSNLHLGSGICPVNRLRSLGIPVGIGSDGGNCGNLNMWEKNRLVALLHRVDTPEYRDWITALDVLQMNTLNGARAMLEDGKTGRIEPGYKADLVVIDIENSLWQPAGNMVNQLVFSETGSSIDKVIVGGRVVADTKRILGIDTAMIFEEAKVIVDRYKKDNEQQYDVLEKQVQVVDGMYRRVMEVKN